MLCSRQSEPRKQTGTFPSPTRKPHLTVQRRTALAASRTQSNAVRPHLGGLLPPNSLLPAPPLPPILPRSNFGTAPSQARTQIPDSNVKSLALTSPPKSPPCKPRSDEFLVHHAAEYEMTNAMAGRCHHIHDHVDTRQELVPLIGRSDCLAWTGPATDESVDPPRRCTSDGTLSEKPICDAGSLHSLFVDPRCQSCCTLWLLSVNSRSTVSRKSSLQVGQDKPSQHSITLIESGSLCFCMPFTSSHKHG